MRKMIDLAISEILSFWKTRLKYTMFEIHRKKPSFRFLADKRVIKNPKKIDHFG